jgi:hypothetical protein
LASAALYAQGPDAFGYTWKKSGDPGGPTLDWIDITGIGTEVTGLGDDNAAAPIQMGMNFHFYWSDFNKITIGSNGWLSFDNLSNIASCFPPIPTADAKNNLICPLMADLNFDNGSPGKIYTYHDQTPGNEKFIISYEGVTFWTQADPIFGSNTFQVILAKADSSITFQYLTMTPDFTYTCTGAGKVSTGIENLTGNIGLQVNAGTVPPSGQAVKFYYPQTITFSITDAAPIANNNADNEGIFLYPGLNAGFSSIIANTGNTAINSTIDVTALVESYPDGLSYYADDQAVAALGVGQTQTVNFASQTIDWGPGTYVLSTFSQFSGDVNPSNDFIISEVDVVDTTGGIIKFGYVTGATSSGTIQWPGGGDGSGGGGIKVVPPVYPITIAGAEAGIAAGATDGFTLKIFDDDGPNGGPGTELTSLSVAGGDYVSAAWNQYLFDDPVTINSGGFYLGWFMDGNTVAILTESEGPISNLTYEILSGSWAKYRMAADIMLRAIAEAPTVVIEDATKDVVDDAKLQVYPNPSHGSFLVDNKYGDYLLQNPQITNALGALVFEDKNAISIGQQRKIKADLAPGLYYLTLKTVDGKRMVRKIIVN